MLLDLEALVTKHNLRITGVIHVGAHLAEEAPIYDRLGIKRVWWIEANPAVAGKITDVLKDYPSQRLISALVLDQPKASVTFNVTNYDGMSSSIFKWGTHTEFSPDTVVAYVISLDSTFLDQLDQKFDFLGCNMLNIDIEGAGLMALQGGTETLNQIDYVYIEVQTENVYDGAPLLDDYDLWLEEHGFKRVELGLVEGQGWGDALYVRN